MSTKNNMNEITKNKYLDFDGLKKYDKLIKSYIALSNRSFAEASDVSELRNDVDALKAIDHDAYIFADVNLEISLKDHMDSELVLKQDVIHDLEDIRSGAKLGNTALQNVPSEYVTEEELADKKYATETQVENLIDRVVNTASDNDIDDIFK